MTEAAEASRWGRRLRERVIAGHLVGLHEPTAGGANRPGPAPVLFLNGACLTSGGWKRVAGLLPDRTLITVDRPGYRGTRLGELPTLHAEVHALVEILETLGGGGGAGVGRTLGAHLVLPVTVVAHSMAAFQAEALARLRPELVGGVVLVDPSLVGPAARKPLAAKSAWQVARAAVGLRPAEGMARVAFRHGLRAQTERGELRDEEWEAAWASAQALAAGAGEWLSYRGQAHELWALRERQREEAGREAGRTAGGKAGRGRASGAGRVTPSAAGGRDALEPGSGDAHDDRRAASPSEYRKAADPVPAPVPAVMLEAPPYASAADLACLRGAFASVRIVRLPRSRHLMMLDEPGAIAEAVRRLD